VRRSIVHSVRNIPSLTQVVEGISVKETKKEPSKVESEKEKTISKTKRSDPSSPKCDVSEG
jgi:hypothetical protein